MGERACQRIATHWLSTYLCISRPRIPKRAVATSNHVQRHIVALKHGDGQGVTVADDRETKEEGWMKSLSLAHEVRMQQAEFHRLLGESDLKGGAGHMLDALEKGAPHAINRPIGVLLKRLTKVGDATVQAVLVKCGIQHFQTYEQLDAPQRYKLLLWLLEKHEPDTEVYKTS